MSACALQPSSTVGPAHHPPRTPDYFHTPSVWPPSPPHRASPPTRTSHPLPPLLPQLLRLQLPRPDQPTPRPVAARHGVVLLVEPLPVPRPSALRRRPGLASVLVEPARGEVGGVWNGVRGWRCLGGCGGLGYRVVCHRGFGGWTLVLWRWCCPLRMLLRLQHALDQTPSGSSTSRTVSAAVGDAIEVAEVVRSVGRSSARTGRTCWRPLLAVTRGMASPGLIL